jgi:carboxylesterase type B
LFLWFAEFLKKASPQQIVDASPKTITEDDARKNIGLAFVPSVESVIKKRSSDFEPLYDQPFLTDEPVKLLKEGNFNKVPLMIGFNSHEAMLFLRRETFRLLRNFSAQFCHSISHRRSEERQAVVCEIRK